MVRGTAGTTPFCAFSAETEWTVNGELVNPNNMGCTYVNCIFVGQNMNECEGTLDVKVLIRSWVKE